MNTQKRWMLFGGLVVIGVVLVSVDFAIGGRGRGGGGGGRGGGGGGRVGGGGGGMARPSGGGGMARPSGGMPARPAGGGGLSSPGINRSPGVSTPRPSQPIANRPSVQPKIGGGAVGGQPKIGGGGQPKIGGGPNFGGSGLGARDGPGIVSQPKLTPGTRPEIGKGSGINPKIGGKGVDPGFGVKPPAIGSKPGGIKPPALGKVDPGFGVKQGGIGPRPGGPTTSLPGLGLGIGAGIGTGIAAGKAGDVLGRRQGAVQDRQANIADRSQNLQGRLDQRQDFRNQNQDQRQDYLNNRREDWQNWHDDYYGHHDGWYHGAWCDHWGDAWQHMWSDHTAAMVLGTTMWGLNRMGYWFGTDSYYNPYYSEPLVVDNTVINYSEPLAAAPPATVSSEPIPPPIVTPAEAPAALPPGVNPEAVAQFDAARAAFLGGNYQEALTATNKALAKMPKDAVIHEFRALVLFALGNYREAATTLHPVLAVGPGWDWTTMISLYPDADTYTKQLRALEAYVTANPKAADGHFVVGYHYLTCGHQDMATQELAQAQKLAKNDTVSAQLLQMTGKPATPTPPAVESAAKYDTAKLVGTWNASRGGKATFNLTMTKDMAFTWVYTEGKKRQEVKGAYALDGNVLALEPDAGGVMLAEITDPQKGTFTFRTVGAPTSDPGLSFKMK